MESNHFSLDLSFFLLSNDPGILWKRANELAARGGQSLHKRERFGAISQGFDQHILGCILKMDEDGCLPMAPALKKYFRVRCRIAE